MPIYVYECPEHGTFEIFTRIIGEVPKTAICEAVTDFDHGCDCGRPAKLAVTAPSRHNIEQTWNDKANEYRRDPYTQAKAQLTNFHRGELEHIERDCDRPENPVTEEAIQIGAGEIDKQNKNPQPDVEDKYIADVRRKSKAARKKAAKEV